MVDAESTLALEEAQLERVLRLTDLVSFNQTALKSATGASDLETSTRGMLELGPRVVIVTLGRQGCLAVTAHEQVRCPGFEVAVVDTTGAGDCFNAASALLVRELSPRGGLPDRGKVLAFLRQRG